MKYIKYTYQQHRFDVGSVGIGLLVQLAQNVVNVAELRKSSTNMGIITLTNAPLVLGELEPTVWLTGSPQYEIRSCVCD